MILLDCMLQRTKLTQNIPDMQRIVNIKNCRRDDYAKKEKKKTQNTPSSLDTAIKLISISVLYSYDSEYKMINKT